MIQLMILYMLCFLNFSLVGFREAAGRNPLISKRDYLCRVVAHANAVGHSLLAVIAVLAWLAYTHSQNPTLLWQKFLADSFSSILLFFLYAVVVGITFAFYAIPNFEVRSLVTIAVFGPLVMLQPLVTIAGWFLFIYRSDEWILISLWSLGTLFILFFEILLRYVGFASKEVNKIISV